MSRPAKMPKLAKVSDTAKPEAKKPVSVEFEDWIRFVFTNDDFIISLFIMDEAVQQPNFKDIYKLEVTKFTTRKKALVKLAKFLKLVRDPMSDTANIENAYRNVDLNDLLVLPQESKIEIVKNIKHFNKEAANELFKSPDIEEKRWDVIEHLKPTVKQGGWEAITNVLMEVKIGLQDVGDKEEHLIEALSKVGKLITNANMWKVYEAEWRDAISKYEAKIIALMPLGGTWGRRIHELQSLAKRHMFDDELAKHFAILKDIHDKMWELGKDRNEAVQNLNDFWYY